jgi:hypothetical protein
MVVDAPVVKAPPILKIKTALLFRWASKVRVPATDAAAAIAYTPACSTSPLPNAGV